MSAPARDPAAAAFEAIRQALHCINRHFADDRDKWEADSQLTIERIEQILLEALPASEPTKPADG